MVTRIRTRLAEKPKEICRGDACQLIRRHALDLRQSLCRVDDEGRLVALAAKRHRREIRRISLDQQALDWQIASDGAELVRLGEGENAGKGNVKS
jgi:hypothetical protein